MTSNYNGRRAPNVTRYLQAMEEQQPLIEDDFTMERDLALFTNAHFYDFETGQNTNFQAQPPSTKIDGEAAPVVTASPNELTVNDMTNFNMGDFDFDFNNYTGHHAIPFADTMSMPQIQAAPLFPQIPQSQPQVTFVQPVAAQAQADPKAKTSLSMEERSRLAAEEDKRRRNTAASARFRVKKKQREAALEKSAREMTQKVSQLELHIKHLEAENKWLRNILLEKHDHKQVAEMLAEGYPGKAEHERAVQELAASGVAVSTTALATTKAD